MSTAIATGQTIIYAQPTALPTGVNAGAKTSTILEVLYEDGTVAYTCADCGKAFESATSVFAHRTAHGPARAKAKRTAAAKKAKTTKPRAASPATLEARVAALIADSADERVGTLERKVATLETLLQQEKRARQHAERDLARVRAILTP